MSEIAKRKEYYSTLSTSVAKMIQFTTQRGRMELGKEMIEIINLLKKGEDRDSTSKEDKGVLPNEVIALLNLFEGKVTEQGLEEMGYSIVRTEALEEMQDRLSNHPG